MKIYSHTLAAVDLHEAMVRAHRAGSVPQHVYVDENISGRTRDGRKSFKFRLASSFKLKGDKRRWRNSGGYGADDVYSATYDEHGFWMAQLFEIDPEAQIGWSPSKPLYADVEDFHAKTDNKYRIAVAA